MISILFKVTNIFIVKIVLKTVNIKNSIYILIITEKENTQHKQNISHVITFKFQIFVEYFIELFNFQMFMVVFTSLKN